MKMFVICLILLLTSGCASLINREKAIAYVQQQLDRQGPENHGPNPDYGDARYWAASPFKVDSSDIIPVGVERPGTSLDADVFFIHPTTYISSHGNTFELSGLGKRPLRGIRILKNSPWNANVDDETVNIKTDILSLANQATAFNGSCRVFAPRYRQANIKAFIVPKESLNATQAFDLAYQDVRNAFDYYLEHHNDGRPIIIASHSQGTLLAERLLKDFFDEKPLLDRLVCAYLVGYKVSPDAFKTIPVGNSPSQIGCVVGWQSFNADATFTEEELKSHGNTIAVNPLSWTTGQEWVEADRSEGVFIPNGSVVKGQVSARIDKHGPLMVKTPPTMDDWLKGSSNFHVWDYNLFWMDIRKNVAKRILAFKKQAEQVQSNRIGFFDENNMNLCALNELDGSIDTLVHIEESTSGMYRRTVWSPDGSHFAFTGTVDGIRATYIADADGGNRQLILKPEGKSDEGVLDWHKNLKLIFVLKNIDGNAEIYSVVDSLHLTNLTKSPSWEFFPTVFPDGRIAFVSNIDEKEGVENSTFKNVYILDPDSVGFKFLLSIEGMDMGSVSTTGIFPDISPDGKLMCFTLKGDIYVIGTDGKNRRNITNTPNLTELTPSFSLDGKSVLYSGASKPETDFLSGNKPNMNLFKIDLETLEKTQLTFGEDNFFTHPLYQPAAN